jgi:adenylate cyclase
MKYDGVIDKYIGDAIMAFWNAPVDVTHHEEKAVRASLAMIEALHKMKTTSPLEIGIGLHSGEAIVGNIGSTTRINYTIIGDAVNACSRLEGLTKKYGLEIIASEQIKRAINREDIIWRKIDIVRVKGKSEILKLYEPIKKSRETEELVHKSDKAFEYYQSKNFTDATAVYKTINDTYSNIMIERMAELEEKQTLSWNGTWDWDEK